MADFQTVDTSGFDEAIAAFKNALETYTSCRDTFSTQSERLNSKWDGVAAEQYFTSYKNIQRTLTDNVDSLTYIIENLESIRQTYLDWDTKAKSTIEGN